MVTVACLAARWPSVLKVAGPTLGKADRNLGGEGLFLLTNAVLRIAFEQ